MLFNNFLSKMRSISLKTTKFFRIGILFQVLFSLSFSPAIAAVQSDTSRLASATESYILGPNEINSETVNDKAQGIASAFATSDLTSITANGHSFGVHDGFPSMGFSSAVFKLNTNLYPDSYVWSSSDPSTVIVNDVGVVTLVSKPSDTVVITATSKNGGASFSYDFKINMWFTPKSTEVSSYAAGVEWCKSLNKPGNIPVASYLSAGTGVRQVGNLWGEWGDLADYPESGFVRDFYFSNTFLALGGSQYASFLVNLGTGRGAYDELLREQSKQLIVCRN